MTLRVPLNHPDRSTVLDHFVQARVGLCPMLVQIWPDYCHYPQEGDKALLQYAKAFDHFPADDMTALSVSSGQLSKPINSLMQTASIA